MQEISARKLGEISIQQANKLRPIALPPFLSIQQDIRRYVNDPFHYGGHDIMMYLHEIVLYSNGCSNHEEFFKQFIYAPISSDILPISVVKTLINKLGTTKPGIIHVAGGNIFDYPDFTHLYSFLLEKELKVLYYVPIHHLVEEKYYKFLCNNEINLKVLCDPRNSIHAELTKIKPLLSTFNREIEWVFVVTSEADCRKVDELSEFFSLSDVTVKPFFTGRNHSFFKRCVFLSRDDIQKLSLTKRNIFAHQVLNTNDFGSITVMPDGEIFANPNFEAIGTIDTPINELLYKELLNGTSWRRIRDKEPCSSCVFQYLCPSPSNYEIAMGIINPCQIN